MLQKHHILLMYTLLTTQAIACTSIPLIPLPRSVTPQEGKFVITKSTKIFINSDSRDAQELLSCIITFLSAPLGKKLEICEKPLALEKDVIFVVLDALAEMGPEEYRLSVQRDMILLHARTTTGAFWGFQTLRQLLPAHAELQTQLVGDELAVPCVEISDMPRFNYRGLMLDVSRHMFSPKEIKKYIDIMAFYKLNTLHWHLTDDQGWRIEIKKYPKLQEISAYRDETLVGHYRSQPHVYDGKRYGGYYSQDEIREIVEYARLRHITIIPEIDLPGHCLAAIAAYPELSCMGGPYKVATKWGGYQDIYCAGNDKVFEFLCDILDEVISLFPGVYIHVGGDEVPKKRWKGCALCQSRIKEHGLTDEHQLQGYFIQRIEKFVNSKGRTIIGWDEILDGGLAPHATVMSWRGIKGGIEAARQGHDVIMTPLTNLYFDFYQSQSPYEPLAIGRYVPLKAVYDFEPIPSELSEQESQHILGAQANIWTEYIATAAHLEYMTYPRAIALAEAVWSPKHVKNYASFMMRLQQGLVRMRFMKVYYADIQQT